MLRAFLCVLLSASVACGTEWDQGSLREAIRMSVTNWDQLGVASSVEKPFLLLQERTRPVVYCYVAERFGECPPCDAAKIAIRSATLPFDVQWTTRDPGYGTGTPTFYWKSNEGWTRLVGWHGVVELKAAVERTTRAVPDVFPRYQLKLTESAESAPTPMREVERVLGLLPTPQVGFVDFGCGDGRWCIAAARRWGCRATGIEIDPIRAANARERVAEAGLSHLVTIIEGDVLTTDVTADVGVVYLYADVLAQLKSRLERLRAFASYMHQPPGIPVVRNGDSWIYNATFPVARSAAVWDGQLYSQPVCNDPNCGMCNSIRSQLGQPSQSRPTLWTQQRKKSFLWWEYD